MWAFLSNFVYNGNDIHDTHDKPPVGIGAPKVPDDDPLAWSKPFFATTNVRLNQYMANIGTMLRGILLVPVVFKSYEKLDGNHKLVVTVAQGSTTERKVMNASLAMFQFPTHQSLA